MIAVISSYMWGRNILAASKELQQLKDIKKCGRKRALARFYNVNSILGNDWAMFYCVLGSRMTGKSYAIAERVCQLKRKYGDGCKVYWIRISETSTKNLLANKAKKLIDPDLVAKYNLELTTKAGTVYDHGKEFCQVYALSGAAKAKGQALYDKDFTGRLVFVLDEFQLEQGERRTSFDILYNFISILETAGRTRKDNVEVWLLGNTLEESSSILKAFEFLPEEFGRFKLRRKRCVIDNLEPTEEYLKDRYGSMAQILGGDRMSNYTNELIKDKELITKQKLVRPTAIIKFGKPSSMWYTLWDGCVVRKYRNEALPKESDFCMRPYINSYYSLERKATILQMYDARALKFQNLIDQSYFEGDLASVRKS